MARTRSSASLAILLLVANVTVAVAAPGPFVGLAGTWSGTGSVDMANGARERLRCRATYDVAGEGNNLRLELECASDSYKFMLAGEAVAQGGAITGSWSETSRNIAGALEGRVEGDRIEAIARGASFAANIALATRGKRQSVTIAPQGASDVTAVNVTLNRK
jgi:hypothetical protein